MQNYCNSLNQVNNASAYYLIYPSVHYLCFQEVNRYFVLLFENNTERAVHTKYFLPTVEIKNYNIMINGQNFFDQPVKTNKEMITPLAAY